MKAQRLEYRVVWTRTEGTRKVKRYATRKGAERFMALLGPEPWTAFGRRPDDVFCCDGHACGCEGLTVRETMLRDRGDMPYLRSAHIECRFVGDWVEASN